jgi:hypothetical protein
MYAFLVLIMIADERHIKNVNYYCLLRTDDLADMAAIPVPGL